MFVTFCICCAVIILAWQARRHVGMFGKKAGPWIMRAPPADGDTRS
jgi:hypothetical protein